MADQQPSYSVPPAPQPKRRLLRYLPWSWTGIVLAVPYLLLVLAIAAMDLRCIAERQSELCGLMTILLSAPSSIPFFQASERYDITVPLWIWFGIPIIINTLLVYLIGAGLGRIVQLVVKALRR